MRFAFKQPLLRMILAACLAMSCTKTYIAKFINISESTIVVQQDQFDLTNVVILAIGEQKKTSIYGDYCIARNTNGIALYQEPLPIHAAGEVFSEIGERYIVVLVDSNSFYPVPRIYRGNWREHIAEIKEAKHAQQARGEDGEPAAAPTKPPEDHPSRRLPL
jgi:hypothetical protein